MGLTVTTVAATRRLSRLQHVKAELGITDAGQDGTIARQIDQATAAIESYCHRAFAREAVTEVVEGWDALELQLARTPLITISSVLFDSEPVTDYSIESRDEGTLLRRARWGWTAQRAAGLTGRQRWPGMGIPLPRSEEPRFSVTYVGGYLLPELNLEDVSTVAAQASDGSFNDSAQRLPALLRAGDVVVASGFTNPANNGRFVVTGTPTASKVTVSGVLVDEVAGPARSLLFEPPAECRPIADLEKAAIEAVKGWYLTRGQDAAIVEKQVGGLRIRRSESDDAMRLPLPPVCVGLLAPWVRRA